MDNIGRLSVSNASRKKPGSIRTALVVWSVLSASISGCGSSSKSRLDAGGASDGERDVMGGADAGGSNIDARVDVGTHDGPAAEAGVDATNHPAAGLVLGGQWGGIRTYGADGYAEVVGVSVDGQGGVVVVGNTTAGFIAKFNRAGDALWSQLITPRLMSGGPVLDNRLDGVATDAVGNIYVAGKTIGNDIMASTAVLVDKYDPNGTLVWQSTFASASSENAALGIAVNADAVFVTGISTGQLPGQQLAGARDNFVAKFDLAGNRIWITEFGTTGYDNAWGLALDGAGGIYVVGSLAGTYMNVDYSNGSFLGKFGEDGSFALGTLLPNVNAQAVASASDGTVYVGGTQSLSKVDTAGVERWSIPITTAYYSIRGIAISSDALAIYCASTSGDVRAFDPDGNQLWQQLFTAPANQQYLPWGVATDEADGNVYVAGAVDSDGWFVTKLEPATGAVQ
jgi:hypothetical protein